MLPRVRPKDAAALSDCIFGPAHLRQALRVCPPGRVARRLGVSLPNHTAQGFSLPLLPNDGREFHGQPQDGQTLPQEGQGQHLRVQHGEKVYELSWDIRTMDVSNPLCLVIPASL